MAAICLPSCSKEKEDEPWNNEEEDDYEIIQGPDQALGEGLIRINNLIYEVNDDGTCTLVFRRDSYDGDSHHCYYSYFPSPVFDVPNEINFKGKKYQVTGVDLSGDNPRDKSTNAAAIKYLSLPSNVLSYVGRYEIDLITLTIGANVRNVLGTRAEKILWLPNTPPSGYTNASARVQYASSSSYDSDVIVYAHLSSMFTVDGIAYVMTDPSERLCDMIGAFAPPSSHITCNGTVSKDGISFTVKRICKYAFYGCDNVTDVKISGIETIGDYAFSGCSINEISIPNTVTSLGIGSFRNCSELSSVKFEDGDSELKILRPSNSYSTPDFNTFEGTKVKKLYIGRDLYYNTSNSRSPFYRMDNLEDVEIRSGETEISNSMFYGCIALKSVVIGDDITTISSKAFSGCSSMTSFKFGNKLKSIGSDAFSDCTALTSFTSEAINPPTCGSQALDDINKWECVLHVPSESIEAYKKADQWKNFLKIE